jgi:hypothetical protein
VYESGPNRIVVAQDHAQELEPVRQLKIESERPNRILTELGEDSKALVALTDKQRSEFHNWLADHKGLSTVEELDAHRVQSGRLGWEPIIPQSAKTDPQWNSFVQALQRANPVELQEALSITKAQRDLQNHALAKSLLPEDLIVGLEALPNRELIKTITLTGRPFVKDRYYTEFDPWAATHAKAGFVSGASANHSTRSIEFYRSSRDHLSHVLPHEQVHLNHSPLYGFARTIDARMIMRAKLSSNLWDFSVVSIYSTLPQFKLRCACLCSPGSCKIR